MAVGAAHPRAGLELRDRFGRTKSRSVSSAVTTRPCAGVIPTAPVRCAMPARRAVSVRRVVVSARVVLALVLALALAPAALPPPPPLPEPTPLQREDHRARGPTPGYFLGHRERLRFGGRLGVGLDGRVAGVVPVRAAFALDAVAVMRVPASRRNELFTLFPELGYSLTAGAQHTFGHLVTAGLGLGGTADGVGGAFMPRFVAGSYLGQRALGLRAGALVEVVKTGGFGLELAYQALFMPDGVAHTIHFTVFAGFYAPTER